jgi:hypothetical protein
MKANQHHKTHTPSDKVRAPKETEREFKTSLFRPVPIHLAGPIPNGFTLPATNLPLTPTAVDLALTEEIRRVLTSTDSTQIEIEASPGRSYSM